MPNLLISSDTEIKNPCLSLSLGLKSSDDNKGLSTTMAKILPLHNSYTDGVKNEVQKVKSEGGEEEVSPRLNPKAKDHGLKRKRLEMGNLNGGSGDDKGNWGSTIGIMHDGFSKRQRGDDERMGLQNSEVLASCNGKDGSDRDAHHVQRYIMHDQTGLPAAPENPTLGELEKEDDELGNNGDICWDNKSALEEAREILASFNQKDGSERDTHHVHLGIGENADVVLQGQRYLMLDQTGFPAAENPIPRELEKEVSEQALIVRCPQPAENFEEANFSPDINKNISLVRKTYYKRLEKLMNDQSDKRIQFGMARDRIEKEAIMKFEQQHSHECNLVRKKHHQNDVIVAKLGVVDEEFLRNKEIIKNHLNKEQEKIKSMHDTAMEEETELKNHWLHEAECGRCVDTYSILPQFLYSCEQVENHDQFLKYDQELERICRLARAQDAKSHDELNMCTSTEKDMEEDRKKYRAQKNIATDTCFNKVIGTLGSHQVVGEQSSPLVRVKEEEDIINHSSTFRDMGRSRRPNRRGSMSRKSSPSWSISPVRQSGLPDLKAPEPSLSNHGRNLSRRGGGFTDRYSSARKYRTPSAEHSPTRSFHYRGRNAQDVNFDRSKSYKYHPECSLPSHYQSPSTSRSFHYRRRDVPDINRDSYKVGSYKSYPEHDMNRYKSPPPPRFFHYRGRNADDMNYDR